MNIDSITIFFKILWMLVALVYIDLLLLLMTGDPLSSSINSISNGTAMSMETKTQEASTSENERLASSPSSYKDSVTNDPDGKDSPVSKDPLSSGQKAYSITYFPREILMYWLLHGPFVLDCWLYRCDFILSPFACIELNF